MARRPPATRHGCIQLTTPGEKAGAANPERAETGPWGHILVSASACILTVSILGSAIFLANKIYRQYELRRVARAFVASLENRTPEELSERAALLKLRPKLAAHFLPEVDAALRESRSEKQLCAAIRMAEEFVDHRRIRSALAQLCGERRESVAAAAVRALARVQPPEEAAALLGQRVEESASGTVGPAALDAAIAGLFQLGAPGHSEMKRRLPQVSRERRIWIAGYVNEHGGPYRAAWLAALKSDTDADVRAAAARATSQPSAAGTAAVAASRAAPTATRDGL